MKFVYGKILCLVSVLTTVDINKTGWVVYMSSICKASELCHAWQPPTIAVQVQYLAASQCLTFFDDPGKVNHSPWQKRIYIMQLQVRLPSPTRGKYHQEPSAYCEKLLGLCLGARENTLKNIYSTCTTPPKKKCIKGGGWGEVGCMLPVMVSCWGLMLVPCLCRFLLLLFECVRGLKCSGVLEVWIR